MKNSTTDLVIVGAFLFLSGCAQVRAYRYDQGYEQGEKDYWKAKHEGLDKSKSGVPAYVHGWIDGFDAAKKQDEIYQKIEKFNKEMNK